MHFCNGQLKTISLLGKAQNCHDKNKGKVCPHHQQSKQQTTSENSDKTADCCENKTLIFQVDTDKDFEVVEQSSIVEEFSSFFILAPAPAHNSSLALVVRNIDLGYSSPIIPRDIYVLLETYLL